MGLINFFRTIRYLSGKKDVIKPTTETSSSTSSPQKVTVEKVTTAPGPDEQKTTVSTSLNHEHGNDPTTWNKTYTINYGRPEYERDHPHHYRSLPEKDTTTAFKTHTIIY